MQCEKSIIKCLKRESSITPQYLKIRKDQNPIFIWGCGSFAVHVYHYCKNYEIPVEGFFVNVPEKKTDFEGLPVLQFETVVEHVPQFSVIIGHANYKEGTAWLQKVKNIENIYCIASCCYDMWNCVSEDFLTENEEILDEFYLELQDETSKKCFASYFESRLNDSPSYMFPCYKKGINYYQNDIFALGEDETLVDVGACVGNSIWPFVDAVDGKYQSIIALEPDENNCHVLNEGIKSRGIQNVTVRQVCAYDKECFVKFCGEQEKGRIAADAEQYRLYPAVTLDGLCHELNANVSLIKLNFAFSVSQVLNGAKRLLREKRPKIIIRAGFDENMFIETYRTIKRLNPDYRLYLRYTIGIPQGLTIFAI